MNVRDAALLGSLVFAVSCGQSRPAAPRAESETNVALEGGIVARVGESPIPLSLVESVVQSQRVEPREALRKVIDDEIAASAARARGLDGHAYVAQRLVALRARLVADRLYEEAKSKGPPTDSEVSALSDMYWTEVDRPPSVVVTHAIVLRPKDPALLPAAREAAHRMRAAVAAVDSDADFEKNAKSVTLPPKLELRVERLPAFTEDGWTISGPGRMDEGFSRAAFSIPTIGGMTDLVETEFGFHVIRLRERLPEKRMPFESRRIAFAEEVVERRARDLVTARLKELQKGREVEILPAAESLMRGVGAAPSNEGP